MWLCPTGNTVLQFAYIEIGAKFVAHVESIFGETKGIYGYKNQQKSFGNIDNTLNKIYQILPAAACGFYCKWGILEWSVLFAICRCAGRDVIELRYNSEAGLSLNKYEKHYYYFTEATIQLYYKDKTFNNI